MTNSNDRLDRIEVLLERSAIASDERLTRLERSAIASDERLTRLEHSAIASDERLSRIENLLEANHLQSNERLTRIEQLVESNNRFLESFSADLKQYTQTMNNLATRIDGVIATANQDRYEANSRLATMQRQLSSIARHLGVD